MFTHPHCLYLSLACRAARDLGTVFLRVGIAVVTEVEIAALAAAIRSLASRFSVSEVSVTAVLCCVAV